MRIENVVALTRGELKTSPAIAYFKDIKLNFLQINRGDLFIAINPSEIKKALYNGAYGVIYDSEEIDPSDQEVAFIKVRDVGVAAFNLGRYELLKKSLRFISVDKVTLEIIKKISKSKSVEFVGKEDIRTLFCLLRNDDASIVFGSDEEFLYELTTDAIENFLAPKDCKLTITGSTLFESVIFVDGVSLRIKLPEFQLKYLENAMNILKGLDVAFDLASLTFTDFFEPIFVDNHLYSKEFGKTSKVVIFAKYLDAQFLKETLQYVIKNTKWAQTLYVLPISLQKIEDKDVIVTLYGSERELRDILEENEFNFAFVVDGDKDKLIKERKMGAVCSLDFNEKD